MWPATFRELQDAAHRPADSRNDDVRLNGAHVRQTFFRQPGRVHNLTSTASALAGPATSGQCRKSAKPGAHNASLEGLAPGRHHGDKNVMMLETLIAAW